MTDQELFERFGHADNFADVEDARRGLDILRRLLDAGSGVAGYLLATLASEGIVAKDDRVRLFLENFHTMDECLELYRRSFPLLLVEADKGSVPAMNFVSIYYQCGIPPAPRDPAMMRYWDERWSLRVKEIEAAKVVARGRE